MSLLDLEYAECSRRLEVEDIFSYHGGEYNRTMEESYSCCMVSNEILLYQKDTILGFYRGKGRGYTLGALFKGRYTKENWIADAALFRQNTLPARVYAPLLLSDHEVSEWLLAVTEKRYRHFLYHYCTKQYHKIIRYYFTFVKAWIFGDVSSARHKKAKQLIEWTGDLWWAHTRTAFPFYNLAKQKISKNYLEKMRATWNRVTHLKSISVEITLNMFSLDFDDAYTFNNRGRFLRKEKISRGKKHTFREELHVADFLIVLLKMHEHKKTFDFGSIYKIMILKNHGILHSIFRHDNDPAVFKYGSLISAAKLSGYKMQLALTPMCRIKNTSENNSALRVRCLRDALYKRFQIAPSVDEYRRFLEAHFNLRTEGMDGIEKSVWEAQKDVAIDHWIQSCEKMDQGFVEDENTIYVVCMPKHKKECFQHIERNNEMDMAWKKRKHTYKYPIAKKIKIL